MVLSFVSYAAAAELSVPSAYPTLQDALDAATPGDTILLADGDHTGSAVVQVDVTIRGTGSANCTLHNDGAEETLRITAGTAITLSGLTLDGGGRRAIEVEGTLVGSDLAVENLGVQGSQVAGLALNVHPGAVVDITGLRATEQVVGGAGALLEVVGATVTLSNCELAEGDGNWAGLIYGIDATLALQDCALHSGTLGYGNGGAVSLHGGSLTVRNSTFGSFVTSLGGEGGAIWLQDGTLVVEDTHFLGTTGFHNGGHLAAYRSDVTIERSTFTGGIANHNGGSLYLVESTVVLRDVTIRDAQAGHDGGAGMMRRAGTVEMVGLRVCDNLADNEAGGFYFEDYEPGSRSIRNSLFGNNTSPFGAALSFGSDGAHRTTVANNVFVGNQSFIGGTLDNFDSDVPHAQVVNNVFLDNAYGMGLASPIAHDYNLFHGQIDDFPWGGQRGPNSLAVDPLLRDPTRLCEPWALLPLPGSPVVDAGDPTVLDVDLSRSDIGLSGGPDGPDGLDADGDGDGFSGRDDCDDTDPNVYLGADEVCDWLDNDCDGTVDEGFSTAGPWYLDLDGDGHFGTPVFGCAMPPDASTEATDCDDGSTLIRPGRPERIYTGLDEDCDPATPDDDLDGDGYVRELDCDDLDPARHPGAPDLVVDGVDDDCNGVDACATLPATLGPNALGDTCGAPSTFEGIACASSTTTGAPDRARSFVAPVDGLYLFSTEASDYDTVLELRTGCPSYTPLLCDDDGGIDTRSRIEDVPLDAGEERLIVIDGYATDHCGFADLFIGVKPFACLPPAVSLGQGAPASWSGTTCGRPDHVDQSCAETLSDLLLGWTAPTTGTYTFHATGTASLALYSPCPDRTERTCVASQGGEATLTVALDAGDAIVLAVGGEGTDCGAVTVSVSRTEEDGDADADTDADTDTDTDTDSDFGVDTGSSEPAPAPTGGMEPPEEGPPLWFCAGLPEAPVQTGLFLRR